MEEYPTLSRNIPVIAPPRLHARKASRSPTRNRLGDDLLSDLSPATTLEAFTSPSGKLKASIEAATPSERAFGLRATVASKKIQEWVLELADWPWPAEGGSVGFEIPAAKRRKVTDPLMPGRTSYTGYEEPTKVNSEEPYYMGSLLGTQVEQYEDRIDEITEEMDELDVEEIKRQVLDTHFSPKSRPSSSASNAPPMPSLFASYTKMDDFTAVVTATVLQSLPNLSRLMRLLDVWTIRLSVLRKVPPLLGALHDAEVSLKRGWNAIKNPVQASLLGKVLAAEAPVLSRAAFLATMDALQIKVTKLGKNFDFMLDTLEGREDTLPDYWLERMDLIERDYGEWVVAGERKVREGEWAILEKKRKEEEARLARLKAEQDALEAARVKALRDAEEAEKARLEAVAHEEARIRAEEAMEAARVKALRDAEEAEKARLEAVALEEASIRAEETLKAAREAEEARIRAEEAEKARLEAVALEEARIRAEEEALKILRAAEEAERARLEAVAQEEARIKAEEALEAARVKAAREAEEVEKARLEALAQEEARIRAEEEMEAARIKALRDAEEAEKARLEVVAREEAMIRAEEALKVSRAAEEAEKARLEAAAQEEARIRAEDALKTLRAAEEAEEAARLDAVAREEARLKEEEDALKKAQIEAMKEAELAKAERDAETSRREAEERAFETVRRKAILDAEEAENARLEALRQEETNIKAAPDLDQARIKAATQAARIEADFDAQEVIRPSADAFEISQVRDIKDANEVEATRLKAEYETQLIPERGASAEIADAIRPKALQTLGEANALGAKEAATESEDSVQRKSNVDDANPPRDLDIESQEDQIVTVTTAAALSIAAVSLLGMSTHATGLKTSALDEDDTRSGPVIRDHSISDDTDSKFPPSSHEIFQPPERERGNIEDPLEVDHDRFHLSSIEAPVKFQAIESQEPALGSPIRFDNDFGTQSSPTELQSFEVLSTEAPDFSVWQGPALSEDYIFNKPFGPLQPRRSDDVETSTVSLDLTPQSGHHTDILSPISTSLTSMTIKTNSTLDGASDADASRSSSDSVGTGWIVINPSETEHNRETEYLGMPSDGHSSYPIVTRAPNRPEFYVEPPTSPPTPLTPLNTNNNLGGEDNVATSLSRSPGRSFDAAATPISPYAFVTPPKAAALAEDLDDEDVSSILSPVVEEELMPSIEVDSLDGSCAACDVYQAGEEILLPSFNRESPDSPLDRDARQIKLHRDSISSNASTVINSGAKEAQYSPILSPQIDTSILDSFPEEHSPSAGRVGHRKQSLFELSPPLSPSATPRLSKQRSLQVLKTPGFDSDSSTAPSTPLDAPSFDNVGVTAAPLLASPRKASNDEQLQQQISSLLETIPARIRLTSDLEGGNPFASQTLRIKKTRRSVTPSFRPSSTMSNYSTYSRAPTPSFTLAPAFSKTTQRSRGTVGNPEIRLYHLSRSTGEAPIKLFVRLVGENGERVMVRVGGGWADLGEYLKEYASHHGRRSSAVGANQIEIQDLPSRVVSGSSVASNSTIRETGRSTPMSRPGSVMGDRPGSSLNMRKTRKSIGASDATKMSSRISNIRNEDRVPSTPLPTINRRAYETPPSTTSITSSSAGGTGTTASTGRSSRLSWTEEDSSLGLAGPKAKKVVMSERDQEWVESMKEKVKLASAEKERRNRERERTASLGEMDKIGGTKRLFRKSVGERVAGEKNL